MTSQGELKFRREFQTHLTRGYVCKWPPYAMWYSIKQL